MHIPDGFVSPATYLAGYALMTPILYYGYKNTKKILNDETFSLVSTLTAFCFIIMMFNIPVPGGTSGHAVGAGVLAVIFGPWVATLCVSFVLFVQAIIFGDGGVTTFSLNALAMAFSASFSAFYVYKILKNRVNTKIALFITGWSSAATSSIVTAVTLGIQPIFWLDISGKPLYFPFGLEVTLFAVVGSHILFFGVVEGVVTSLTLKIISKIDRMEAINVKF